MALPIATGGRTLPHTCFTSCRLVCGTRKAGKAAPRHAGSCHGSRLHLTNAIETANSAAATTQVDAFVGTLLDKLARSSSDEAAAGNASLRSLTQQSAQRASELRWPSRKDEAYRFTDMKPLRDLLEASLQLDAAEAEASPLQELEAIVSRFRLSKDEESWRLVFVDGRLRTELSRVEGLPEGVVAGSLVSLPADEVARFVEPHLGKVAYAEDLFSSLNGVAASDVAVIALPGNTRLVGKPIHVLHLATSAPSSPPPACPRLLVVAHDGAEVELVEEYADVAAADRAAGASAVNAVTEVVLGEGAEVRHCVVQDAGRSSVCLKYSHVAQAAGSRYSLVEAQVGAQLSRHNLTVRQLGADTSTRMSSFALSGKRQLQDLHSCLVLDHPRGEASQLHKCIVTDASGHCVFDGNVKVNKLAQQTNAGQLTRSLLLAPRGTVSVKPNLQIIADDVRCTHGAAISDLDDEQLFYFRSRGIDERMARSALVYSFGAEVLERLPYSQMRERVEEGVRKQLAEASGV